MPRSKALSSPKPHLPRHRDPRSEYYIPNDFANRKTASAIGGHDGPPYAIDHEALAFGDSVRVLMVGHKDPLQAVEMLVERLQREDFSRERQHCSACKLWDSRGGWGLDAKRRPPGVHDPDGCDGCLLSKLDALGEDPRQREDRLYADWVETKCLQERNSEAVRAAPGEAARKRASEDGKRLKKRLETIRGACEMAGFDPAKRRRQLAKHVGEVPELGHHHDRERKFEPKTKDCGPHWRHGV